MNKRTEILHYIIRYINRRFIAAKLILTENCDVTIMICAFTILCTATAHSWDRFAILKPKIGSASPQKNSATKTALLHVYYSLGQ